MGPLAPERDAGRGLDGGGFPQARHGRGGAARHGPRLAGRPLSQDPALLRGRARPLLVGRARGPRGPRGGRALRAAGVIAAGLGQRLKDSHPGVPKPLVPVAGRPLAHWVVSGLLAAGVERVTVLLNSRGDAAREALERGFPGRVAFLRADPPTSFDSFRLVAAHLARTETAFLMSTVDALVPPAEVRRFAAAALSPFPDGAVPEAAVALTRYIDDEKPLWTATDPTGRVSAFGDAVVRRDAVTCGLYALTAGAAATLPPTAARLRDWWSSLPAAGRPVRGVLLSDTVDVDRPEDLPAAERLAAALLKEAA
ncbi:hypothetical protein EPO15_10255 [bacterium]|nr:MAG: hypothetical protein EPO15_10255 [bacterium]